LAFRLADCIVCNSRAAACGLTRAGLPNNKIRVIPNALPEEAFAETAPALPRSEDVLRVGMIARMNNPVKNYPVLLDAAARLAAKHPSVEFLLVGDGPLRPELETMTRTLRIERQVRFLGDRRDIAAVLASMDISVLTSQSESLSNAIIESMAAGLPAVATRVGGNPDLVCDGETGFLIPPGDAASLADALDRLLTSPDLRRDLGRKAKAFALEHFSLARVLNEYEDLYASLLARKDRRAARSTQQ
ncbi:MAG: glycosyltransferase, partial [Terriglobia bacterium]